jgi:hypothetical protein
MRKIIIEKDGVEKSFESVAKAYIELGATSGMNTENGIKFIENKGWKIVKIDNEKKDTTLIEKLVKQVSVIDKTLIEKLETEKIELVKTLKPSTKKENLEKTLIEMEKIDNEIEKAKNPKASIEDIVNLVKRLYKEYMNDKQG